MFYLLDELNKKIKPNHWDAYEGESAKFTCTGSPKYIWVFNKRHPLPWDIRIQKQSIIIEKIQLNHSDTYQCGGINLYSSNIFRPCFIATATLKVFGKWCKNTVLQCRYTSLINIMLIMEFLVY